MTQIVSYLSQDVVILASDRRITWPRNYLPDEFDDDENKAVVLCGHMLLGYTGFARLGSPVKRTEHWVVDTLRDAEPHAYMSVLADGIQKAIDDLGVPDAQKGHAFLAAGYVQRDKGGPLVPAFVTVSNVLAEDGHTWQLRPEFEIWGHELGQAERSIDGVPPLASWAWKRYARMIAEYKRRFPDSVFGVARILVELIRDVADSRPGVGDDVSIAILPRGAVPAQYITVDTGQIREPVTELTCFTVGTGRTLHHYGPALVCPGTAMYGIVAGALPPGMEFDKQRAAADPPWRDVGRRRS